MRKRAILGATELAAGRVARREATKATAADVSDSQAVSRRSLLRRLGGAAVGGAGIAAAQPDPDPNTPPHKGEQT